MKAKVIATGEIVDVYYYQNNANGDFLLKETSTGSSARLFLSSQLEFIDDEKTKSKPEEKFIDWEQRRFELVKAAMQTIIPFDDGLNPKEVAESSVLFADAVIAKLKEE